jgi:DNA-binding NtrC family response regulator
VDFQEAFDSFRRILIVDDETNVRLNLRMTLETDGYEICESCSDELLKDHEKAKK